MSHSKILPLLLCCALGLGATTPTLSSASEVSSTSAVQVHTPDTIQILSIDGTEQPGALFGARKMTLKLTPGEHVLSVRYTQLFALGADDHDIVKSPPVAFRFTSQAGQEYRFQITPPKRHDQAVQFAKQPDIKLVDVAGGREISGVLVKSLAQASLMDTMSKALQNVQSDAVNGDSERLESLKTLWLNATPEERRAFAVWQDKQLQTK
jgi:uncharacterized protein YccT (UPF0319 family)